MFWTGGITNPLDVIEQITYLMFIRELDVVDNEKSSSSLMLGIPYNSIFDETHQLCRWSQFKNYPAEEMYKIVQEQVFPFIKGLHGDEESAYSKYMADAIFKIPTPQLLEQIVTAMDEIDWKDSDIRGDLYEYLLSKIATAGTNGQFRTPRHIIRMMVDLVAPNPEDVICEMLLTILSSLSQEESRSISENVTWGLRKKFADGKFSVGYSRFLGYDKGEDGNLAINEKQAKTVRLIFGLFIEGLTTCAIAKELTRRGILTVTGKNKWNAATIATISTEARNAKRPM